MLGSTRNQLAMKMPTMTQPQKNRAARCRRARVKVDCINAYEHQEYIALLGSVDVISLVFVELLFVYLNYACLLLQANN